MVYPNRLEAGTINLLDIIGLGKSLAYVEMQQHTSRIREMALLHQLRDGLRYLDRVRLFPIDATWTIIRPC